MSGHRGLPGEVAAQVAEEVSAQLQRIAEKAELVGLSCLADGADQIFATAVLNCGGKLEVIVPAEEYRDRLPDSAKPQYDNLMSRASAVHRRPFRDSTSEAHMDASRFMVDHADRLVAVWDGEPSRAYGGTADVVKYAEDRGVPVLVIWPDGAYRD